MLEVARRYYPNPIDAVKLPYDLGYGVTLHDSSRLAPLCTAAREQAATHRLCLSIRGVEERHAMTWFHAFEDAIHFHSGTLLSESYTVTCSGFEHSENDSLPGWSVHSHAAIAEPALRFASRTLADLEALMLPETFNRVSNALRLYHAAQRSAQPDFALLGFIGCLESLFSVATQELSFRLCLT